MTDNGLLEAQLVLASVIEETREVAFTLREIAEVLVKGYDLGPELVARAGHELRELADQLDGPERP